ncbi:hypothetical protein V6N11_008296 [Hibiscus sabdariffa]|uniref:Uncharacterized protein n=1 Tax=Hibiscus sabdariffa TaxID=183260 RepID=A0ABR2Q084_9ROSI
MKKSAIPSLRGVKSVPIKRGKRSSRVASNLCAFREMGSYNQGWLLFIGILVTLSLPYSHAFWGTENKVQTSVFLSPKFVLGPGSVENRFYYNIDFPKGHIAVKSFDAEVIDEAGNSVPLHETYLHHWVVGRYFVRKGVEISEFDDHAKFNKSDYISGRNSGICPTLGQVFGLGSETRKTATHVPDPYGIEFGNPAEIPSGFEEQWLLNIHAIDTRGVEDKLGCTECRCDLYNVTVDEYGRPLRPDYKGGLFCCYDHTQCRVKHGFEGVRRTLYLRYTVKWIDMDRSVLPVKIYIFDITDTWKGTPNSTGSITEHRCKVEYDIEPCHATGLADDGCIDNRRISLDMPFGGYLIYGVAHQHSGGSGFALYREDGQVMCSSLPIYGEGEEPGNEAGYIVGMTTCYPQPGAIEISKGETLILESNYSSIRHHTGVMGLLYIYVADQLPKPMHTLHTVIQIQDSITLLTILWAVVVMIGAVAVIAVAIRYRLKREGEDGYEAIGMEMQSYNHGWLLLVGIFVTISLPYSQAFRGYEKKVKTAVFRSPKFVLGPGEVENKFYFNIEFPRGHIGLKSFNAEVIDEAGNPVPLLETYLHHWVVARYHVRKDIKIPEFSNHAKLNGSNFISGRNKGICQSTVLPQYFGLGSESRNTVMHIPDPYAIPVGNPAEIPSGFEEQWMLNIHAIDTRGVEDILGCIECRCDTYNVTVDQHGKPLRPGYKGGVSCCHNGTRCKVKQGFQGARRTFYLRYIVKWIDMDSSVLPVNVYILDITDTWKKTSNSTGINTEHHCKMEYEIEPCDDTGSGNDGCMDNKRISLDMPFRGYIIYAVAHQHPGGTGSALYREDGQLLCSSTPRYGKGEEPGDEAGSIVEMTTCYIQPGIIEITKGETVILESNYSRISSHSGVMGLFYILVVDRLPKTTHNLHGFIGTQETITLLAILWAVVAMIGVVAAITVAIRYRFKRERGDGYEAIRI